MDILIVVVGPSAHAKQCQCWTEKTETLDSEFNFIFLDLLLRSY